MDYNYFEVLELSIDDIRNQDEARIKKRVNDAHTKLYALTIGAYANVPRSDGLTQAQWQKVLNDAKATLLDPRKRQKHIADLMPETESTQAPETTKIPEPESTQAPETTKIPELETTQAPESKWGKWIALSTVHLLIAILLWTWAYHLKSTADNSRDLFDHLKFFLLALLGAPAFFLYLHFVYLKFNTGAEINFTEYLSSVLESLKSVFFKRMINFLKSVFFKRMINFLKEIKPDFALNGIVISVIPSVFFIETVLFYEVNLSNVSFGEFGFPYVSLFLTPFFIFLDFLKTRFRVGFFKYCWVASKDIVSDYFFWHSIQFLWDCLCNVRYRYWWLIAIICGTLAGGLAFYGGNPDSLGELFELGFGSSATIIDIDFVFSDFLIGCLYGFVVVVPFLRGAFRRRLGLMIKRLIMIGTVILAMYVPYMFDWDENFHGNFHFLLPAALTIIFYYTVGYIRFIRRYLTK